MAGHQHAIGNRLAELKFSLTFILWLRFSAKCLPEYNAANYYHPFQSNSVTIHRLGNVILK